jgi:16S rRNA (cytidine1402-2'-O)-methyltransferase
MSGTLYLVPMPIGDARDITRRALEVLAEADLVAAEDTREAQRWFGELDLYVKKLVSYHDHNERTRAPWLVDSLAEGKSVALISDAGTPLISDPGWHVVQQALAAGARVVSLPGACAAVTALVASGLATDRFYFGGFLPRDAGPRKNELQSLRRRTESLIFYEAPHRVLDTLADIAAVLGPRKVALAFNLTKSHESVLRGTPAELTEILAARERVSGEITMVVAGSDEAPEWLQADALIARLRGLQLPPSSIRDVVADTFELPRRAVYQRILDGDKDDTDD